MRIICFLFISVIITVVNGCRKNVKVELGSQYRLITSASRHDLTIVKNEGEVVVFGHVLNYAFDSTFIVAAESPRDSVAECSGKILGSTLKNCDEAFEKSTFRQYWIINKKSQSTFDSETRKYSNVYGPYKKKDYLQKCKDLNVPSTLQFRE